MTFDNIAVKFVVFSGQMSLEIISMPSFNVKFITITVKNAFRITNYMKECILKHQQKILNNTVRQPICTFSVQIDTVPTSCCHSHSVIATWNDSHSILSGQKQGVVNHTHVKLQHNTIKERQN